MILRAADRLAVGAALKLELPAHGVDVWRIMSLHTIGDAMLLKLETVEGGFDRVVNLFVSDLVEVVPE